MPESLKNMLRHLSDHQARLVWDYLDGNPDAVHEMIAAVVESHKALVDECMGVAAS